MAKFEVGRIDGLREAREGLAEMSRTVARNVGKRALKQGPGRVFVEAIKAKARVSSRASDPTPGSMRDAVKLVDSRPEKGRATVAILVDDIAAVPNEFGLRHRNYPAHPFVRPGIDGAREEAGAAMARELKSEVDAAIAKAAAKGKKF
jgi:hypothetical protein